MKKLLVGLMAAAMMAFGLVAATSSPALACSDEYQGCVGTEKPEVKKPKKIKPGDVAKIRFDIKAKSGDPTIYGTVTYKCTKANGKAVRKKTRQFEGEPVAINFFKLNKGKWNCFTRFNGINARNKKETFVINVRR